MPRTPAQIKGDALEHRAAAVLRRLGKWRVQVDARWRDHNGNGSQVDLTFRDGPLGLFRFRAAECKAYDAHKKPVALDEVAKFKEVLTLNGWHPSRGLFITTGVFSPRATTIGIECWDGNRLRQMERWASIRRVARGLGALGVAAAVVAGPPERGLERGLEELSDAASAGRPWAAAWVQRWLPASVAGFCSEVYILFSDRDNLRREAAAARRRLVQNVATSEGRQLVRARVQAIVAFGRGALRIARDRYLSARRRLEAEIERVRRWIKSKLP